jgi:hypothetical protein
LLDRIEKEMPKAMPEVQWTMNNTLAAIGTPRQKISRSSRPAVGLSDGRSILAVKSDSRLSI